MRYKEEQRQNHILQNSCKEHDNLKGQEMFKNPSRGIRQLAVNKKSDCIFCQIEDYVLENDLAYAIFDKFPATKGHMLIIPKRHEANFFNVTKKEREAIFDLVDKCKELLDDKYNPDGYNVGINVNECGGQTVFHVHVHLMPRFKGDVVDPTGGVRGAIPHNMKYAMK